MATRQTCCHLPGEMLNLAAECADRARIQSCLWCHTTKSLDACSSKTTMVRLRKFKQFWNQRVETAPVRGRSHRVSVVYLCNNTSGREQGG
jgi:hypothetical protein